MVAQTLQANLLNFYTGRLRIDSAFELASLLTYNSFILLFIVTPRVSKSTRQYAIVHVFYMIIGLKVIGTQENN